MSELTYYGTRFLFGAVVTVVGEGTRRGLKPRSDLCNHSPTGFEWGYCGSGPAQLALALLCDALGNDEVAEALYQDFKREVVAGWSDDWKMTRSEIFAWQERFLWRTGTQVDALIKPGGLDWDDAEEVNP